jgi:hypothetical protein
MAVYSIIYIIFEMSEKMLLGLRPSSWTKDFVPNLLVPPSFPEAEKYT